MQRYRKDAMGNEDNRKLATLQALAKKEPEQKKKETFSPAQRAGGAAGEKKKNGAEDELSEEDEKIKEDMELLVERMQDLNPDVVKLALETLSVSLRAATSSLTSVPKPLKFLRPHIPSLIQHYKQLSSDAPIRADFAMVLAVLCTTYNDGKRRSLYFCLEAGCKEVCSWGFEFLRNLSAEIAAAYAELHGEGQSDSSSQTNTAEQTSVENADSVGLNSSESKSGSGEKKKKTESSDCGDVGVGSVSLSEKSPRTSEKTSAVSGGETGLEVLEDKKNAFFVGAGVVSKDDAEEKDVVMMTRESDGALDETQREAVETSSSVDKKKKKKKQQEMKTGCPMPEMVIPLPTVEQLFQVVDLIVPYYMSHNAEVEGVDLLAEVERLETVVRYTDSTTYKRIVLYLLAMGNFAATFEEFTKILEVAFDLLEQQQQWFDALRVALRLASVHSAVGQQCIERAIIGSKNSSSNSKLLLKQQALLLQQQGVDYSFGGDEQVQRLNTGEELSSFFLQLAKETDVLEPKLPEDVYKTHLEEPPFVGGGSGSRRVAAGAAVGVSAAGGVGGVLDSAKQNLAATFVNAFVNAGFCQDKLMLVEGTAGSSWLYKNKDHGMISAAASLGAILLWNIDEGLSHLDKYQYSSDANIKAGALLGFGVLSSNVRHECDAAFALLKEHLEDSLDGSATRVSPQQKIAAVIGLGCACAGTKRQDVMETLTVIAIDSSLPTECSAFAAVSLGLVFVGSCNQEAAEAILTTLIDRSAVEKGLDSPLCFYFALGLALLFLGARDACEPTLTALETLPSTAAAAFATSTSSSTGSPFTSPNSSSNSKKQQQQVLTVQLLTAYAQRTVEGFAYAGSGDVLKVQRFLSICSEQRDKQYWADLIDAHISSHDNSARAVPGSQGVTNSSNTATTGGNSTTSDGVSGGINNSSSSSSTVGSGSDGGGKGSGEAAAATAKLAVAAAALVEEEEEDDDDDTKKIDKAVAVMSVALISFAEDVGSDMTLRMLEHILQYGDLAQRRAVPLALALHSPSRAKFAIIDTLSKLSHDVDADVALNAIFAMGIVGAGTNNARIAAMLRSLASYYGKDGNALFVIRLAQGLLYLGKGLLTINPLHSDRFLINNVSLGCLCVIMHTCLHMRQTILSRYHYLLYFIFPALRPRMLITLAPASQVPKALQSSAAAAAESTSNITTSSISSGSSSNTSSSISSGGSSTSSTSGSSGSSSSDRGKDELGGARDEKMEDASAGVSSGEAAAIEAAAVATTTTPVEAVVEVSAAAQEAALGEEELKMICVPVRVGEAVDIVGQVARQPKTITAFQTHTTPVLLSYSERAEFVTDDYVALATVLEGVVILKKNPNYKPPKHF